jgi:hypothetical protein
MKNRKINIAHILREHIVDYQKKYPLHGQQYKIVYDLLSCRTAYLGGHIDKCDCCGTERITYNSCRNRHCPTCQNVPRERWLKARKQELLPLTYFHTVFTLPHDLNPIIVSNKKIMLDILFKSVAETLLTFGHNPKNGLGGKLGFIAILHTWDQRLNAHFHLHCLIAGGAMTQNGKSFKPYKKDYLFNEEALGLVFRGKFIEYMSQAYQSGSLTLPGICAPYERPEKFKQLKKKLYCHKWVASVQEPIRRPDYVLEYLGRYTHRVAISNQRIISLKDALVTFTYKNRKTKKTDTITIDAVEFIRRFLLHALPQGFVRVRHFGFLANRNKSANLAKLRRLLHLPPQKDKADQKSMEEMMRELTGIDITICPCCKKGKMKHVAEIPIYTGLNPKQLIRPPRLSRSAA